MRTRVHAKRAHTRTHICDNIYAFGATIGNSQARCACSRTLRPRTVRKRTSAGALVLLQKQNKYKVVKTIKLKKSHHKGTPQTPFSPL